MTLDVPLSAKIDQYRGKIAQGQELSMEEMREALAILRQGRVGAAVRSAASRAKKGPKEVINGDDLLKDLD